MDACDQKLMLQQGTISLNRRNDINLLFTKFWTFQERGRVKMVPLALFVLVFHADWVLGKPTWE